MMPAEVELGTVRRGGFDEKPALSNLPGEGSQHAPVVICEPSNRLTGRPRLKRSGGGHYPDHVWRGHYVNRAFCNPAQLWQPGDATRTQGAPERSKSRRIHNKHVLE